MPISHSLKLLFIHIPKTAGDSIESFFNMQDSDSMYNPNPIYNYSPQHYPIDILKKVVKDYDGLYKFAFVRNPYTRMVSEYLYINRNEGFKYKSFDGNTFHLWLEEYTEKIDTDHKELQANFIDYSIDFVGKFENLHNDFEKVKSELIDFWKKNDIEIPEDFTTSSLPHKNYVAGDKESIVKTLMKEKSKTLIAEIYNKDFIRFNYNF